MKTYINIRQHNDKWLVAWQYSTWGIPLTHTKSVDTEDVIRGEGTA